MTITREQIADLQPGDVVEMSWAEKGATITIRGPLISGHRRVLLVGTYWVREEDGSPIQALQKGGTRTLTVVSRAPRPLYVNHPRTEAVNGDVVRDADGPDRETWYRWENWWTLPGNQRNRSQLPARLRLLVDGETGQVVP